MNDDSELDQSGRNFFSLLWGIIRHPIQTLEYLGQTGGRAWIPMAFLAVLSVVLLILVAAPITSRATQEAIRTQLESQPNLAPAGEDPEMQARISQFATNPLFTVVMPSFAGVAAMIIGWLVWAGALHLLSVMAGGDSRFGGMWSGVVWAFLPNVLRNGLQIVFILLTGETITNQGLSGLVTQERSVSELIASPPGPGQLALRTLLAQIDLFTIWNLVLLFLAVMTIARVSRRKSLGITLGVWAGLLVIRIFLAVVPTWLASGIS
jgi:hypothetical protein